MIGARQAFIAILILGATALLAMSMLALDLTHSAIAILFASAAVGVGLLCGRWIGCVTGLLGAGGLAWMMASGGGLPWPDVILSGLALCAVGMLTGVIHDHLRERANELEESALTLRRELYRLKKESRSGPLGRGEKRLTDSAIAKEIRGLADGTGGVHRHESGQQAAASPGIPQQGDESPGKSGFDAKALAEATRLISSSLTETRIIESTLDVLSRLTGNDRAVFHAHDRSADLFLPGSALRREDRVQVGQNELLLRAVLHKRELVYRGDQDADVARAFEAGDPALEWAVPVFDRAMLTAVVLVGRPATPLGNAAELLAVLTGSCGLALSSARLLARCERQELLDPLTGLVGVSAIRELLAEKLERGLCGAMLIAANGIRKVNEQYGRRMGDKIVGSMARLVEFEIGADGLVGRYGGATLLVVLPGHRMEAVEAVGERLRRRVPMSIHAGPDGLAEPLTISLGVASASSGSVDVVLQQIEVALAQQLELAERSPSGDEKIHA